MNRSRKAVLSLAMAAAMVFLFSGCSAQKSGGLKYTVNNNEVTIKAYKDKTTVTTLEIPDEIQGLPVVMVDDFGAFNAESLKTIKIGKNVREIGGWAFTNEASLVEYIVDENNMHFTSVDGVLFTKDMKTLVYYPNKKGVETNEKGNVTKNASYTIPEGVETIRTKAFYKCANIESVILPDSLKIIEEKAFHKAAALKTAAFPDGLQAIGKDAFAFCSAITEITVPESVKRIDEYAFYNCSAAKKLTMLGEESSMSLGKKWYPTQSGREIDGLTIVWVNRAD